MSHLDKISVKFKDQSCLVEALQRLGFYHQIYDKPVHLYGYPGDKRSQTAHIIVPRNQISHSSNDLGFFWNSVDYDCLISKYDQQWGQAQRGMGLGSQFLSTKSEIISNRVSGCSLRSFGSGLKGVEIIFRQPLTSVAATLYQFIPTKTCYAIGR